MTESIKASISVTYTDTVDNVTKRLLDESSTHVPVSHNSGKANLTGVTLNHELVSSANLVVLKSDGPISIKIGDTTNPEHTNMTAFLYDGTATTIFVSNNGTDPVNVEFVSAKY